MHSDNNIGFSIYYYRKKSGLTQKELADRLNISVPTLIGYEKGKRIPDAAFISQCAKEFRTSLDNLLKTTIAPVSSSVLFTDSATVESACIDKIMAEFQEYLKN